jgi:hypothetical protein
MSLSIDVPDHVEARNSRIEWNAAPSTSCVASSTGGSGPRAMRVWEDQVRMVTPSARPRNAQGESDFVHETSCSLGLGVTPRRPGVPAAPRWRDDRTTRLPGASWARSSVTPSACPRKSKVMTGDPCSTRMPVGVYQASTPEHNPGYARTSVPCAISVTSRVFVCSSRRASPLVSPWRTTHNREVGGSNPPGATAAASAVVPPW